MTYVNIPQGLTLARNLLLPLIAHFIAKTTAENGTWVTKSKVRYRENDSERR